MQCKGERIRSDGFYFSLGSRRWDHVLHMKGRVLGEKFEKSGECL